MAILLSGKWYLHECCIAIVLVNKGMYELHAVLSEKKYILGGGQKVLNTKSKARESRKQDKLYEIKIIYLFFQLKRKRSDPRGWVGFT